ncbi:MAG: GAF domain-containing sensor histidine kinase [Candidatus Omnitrophica bacterium]|nr:GAF domain-containing sensor histidine kinase [Candidatus Omnitrophota bacterium]
MQEYLESILNQCLDILESNSGSILLVSNNSREIIVRAARGRKEYSILGKRLRFGEGISGFVAEQRRPLLVEDVSKENFVKDRCRQKDYRTNSFLSVPLIYSGKLLGVINITEKNNEKPFTLKELSFVSAIAMSAAKTIEKNIHCEHLEKQLQCFKDSTAVTKFASSVAHELNNPLDGVMRYTRLCLSCVGDQNDVLREYLLEIQSGLKRMAGIIKSMLAFSFAGDRNHSPLMRQKVDINALLEKVVSFNRNEAYCKNVEIQLRLEKDLPKINDCGLEQVFMNFVKNSLDAIDKDGKIIIKDYRSNGHICIDFIDSGSGVDEELRNKIFEPFFTTKSNGKGLGLAIVKEIIDCYKGKIEMESVSGSGTKFTVKIPSGGLI